MSNKIMLIACGSFSPPTPMHLRMLEIGKDYFKETGTHEVLGGIVSPVHDAYGKQGLVAQTHRLEMVRLALKSSDWIRLSDWECRQNEWSRTRSVLQFHQNFLNDLNNMRDMDNFNEKDLPSWIPESARNLNEPVQIKLLCGADLLESFATPDLWDHDDLEAILSNHGIVVISRHGSNPEKFIFESDLLTKYKKNITIVTNWVANEVSSTLVRRFISRNLSVKYLLDDSVIAYINQNSLYRSSCGKHFDTKYTFSRQSADTSVSTLLLTPISPESDNATENLTTYNESYVKIQNVKNDSSAVAEIDDYESMDETDFPPPPPELKSISMVSSLSNESVRRPNPSNLKITVADIEIHNRAAPKVGDDARQHHLNVAKLSSVFTPSEEDFGTSDNAQTLSPTSPAQIDSSALTSPKIDESDSEYSLSAPIHQAHGRFSPKTYDEMIKFVFTEHGIRVISDKEYVV